MATRAGTERFRERFDDEFGKRYFRSLDGQLLSSIGAGTYLGEPTDETDERYRKTLAAAFESGVNVVDTAINYRCQRSERTVGRAIADADVDREELFITTKGGYLPFDGERPVDPASYVRSEYIDPGLVDPDDLAEGIHCIAPEYIDRAVDRSLANLGVDTIDCYLVHQPETQLSARSREAVYDQLEATFARLEARVAAGDLRRYGLATWDAFRVPRDADSYLSFPEVISRAETAAAEVGSGETHLRAIQLPFSPVMADAFTVRAHETPHGERSALGVAYEADIAVFTSAPLAQGRFVEEPPEDATAWYFGGDTMAQRAINFARSAPAVTSAIVGMRSTDHLEENLTAGTFDSMSPETFVVVFE